MEITAQNRNQIRDILSTKIEARPDYHTEAYAEMCEPYRFRYYSRHRPVGSWIRVGQDMLTVDELGGSRHGFVYTKAPIDPEKLLSLELFPITGAAWDALFQVVYDYDNGR